MAFKPIAALLAQIIAAIGSNGVGGITGQVLQTQLVDIVDTVGGLSADRYVYVSPSGNDTTGDGSVGNPYATIAKAVEPLPRIDLNGYTFKVLLADGTYTFGSSTMIPAPKSYGSSSGTVYIEGQSGVAANVIVGNGAAACFNIAGRTTFKNLTFKSTAGGAVLAHYLGINSNFTLIDNCEFDVYGSCIEAYYCQQLCIGVNNMKLRSAPYCIVQSNGSRVRLGGCSINWNGFNPTTAICVLNLAAHLGLASAWVNTGTTTAAKYSATYDSMLYGYNFIGTGAAGSVANGATAYA